MQSCSKTSCSFGVSLFAKIKKMPTSVSQHRLPQFGEEVKERFIHSLTSRTAPSRPSRPSEPARASPTRPCPP